MTTRLSGKTRLIGLFGSPVSHSLSPRIQNALFEALALDYAYLAFDVTAEKAEAAASTIRTLNMRGANVTMPLKRAIMPFLDALSPASELAGAVNVIVNDAGLLTGHVTDGEGFALSLAEAGVDYAGKRLVMLGAGGAAIAVAVQLAMGGVASIAFFNRRDAFWQEAENLSARLGGRFGCDINVFDLSHERELAAQIRAADILINATPIGMKDTLACMALPNASLLHPRLVVCDLIYVPRETHLLRQAQAIGCKTVSGTGMQLWQALPAFRMWTGQEADVEIARRALLGEEQS